MSRLIVRLALMGLALALFPTMGQADETELPADVRSHLESLPDDLTRIEYLNGLAEKSPADFAIQYHLGNLTFDVGQYEAAVSHLEKAVQIRPDVVAGQVNLGSAYDEIGQLDKALGAYQKALELDPTEVKTLCNIGGVYFQKRQLDKAMESFVAATEADPNSQLAHYNLAILFADSGIFQEAITEWQKVVAIDPDSDLGSRSADNIEIIKEMQSTQTPAISDDGHDHGSHEGHSHDN